MKMTIGVGHDSAITNEDFINSKQDNFVYNLAVKIKKLANARLDFSFNMSFYSIFMMLFNKFFHFIEKNHPSTYLARGKVVCPTFVGLYQAVVKRL